MLKNLGAICIEVTRGDKPNWYNDALSGNTSQLELLKIHKSEYDWIGTDFDYTLDNNGTLDDVYTQVETVLSAKRQAKDPQASMLTPASV